MPAAGRSFGSRTSNAGQTGQFVGLALDGDAFFHAQRRSRYLSLRYDRVGVRVPVGDDGASVNLVTFLHGDHSTVRQLVALTLTTDSSAIASSPERETATRLPSCAQRLEVVQTDRPTVSSPERCQQPRHGDAAPPMWKVRMVSCVPGSPID